MIHAGLLRISSLVGLVLASATLARSTLLEKRTSCLRYSGSIHVMNQNDGTQAGWLDKGGDWTQGTGGNGGRFRMIEHLDAASNPNEANQGTFFFVNCGSPFHVYCDGCDENGMDLVLGIESSGGNWFPTAVAATSRSTEIYQRADGDQSPLWTMDSNDLLTPFLNGAAYTQTLLGWDDSSQSNWQLWWGDTWLYGQNSFPTNMFLQFVSTSGDPVPVSVGPPIDSSPFICGAM